MNYDSFYRFVQIKHYIICMYIKKIVCLGNFYESNDMLIKLKNYTTFLTNFYIGNSRTIYNFPILPYS